MSIETHLSAFPKTFLNEKEINFFTYLSHKYNIKVLNNQFHKIKKRKLYSIFLYVFGHQRQKNLLNKLKVDLYLILLSQWQNEVK